MRHAVPVKVERRDDAVVDDGLAVVRHSQLLSPRITNIRQSADTALGIAGLDISVARIGREERDVVAFAAADERELRRVILLPDRLSGLGRRHPDRFHFALDDMAELSLADAVAEEELHVR